MIITESMLVGYTVINGTWQLQLALLASSLYVVFAYPDVDWGNSYNHVYIPYTGINLIILHIYMSFVTIFQQFAKADLIGITMSLNFIGILATTLVLLIAANTLNYLPWIKDCPNIDTAAFVKWLQIELFFNVSLVVSNIVFLFCRSLFKHKIRIEKSIDNRKKIPQIDTLVALKSINDAWNNECLPLIMSNFIFFGVPSTQRFESVYWILVQEQIITASCYVSTFIIFILVFISWQKGPLLWIRFSPYFYYTILLIVYIILPVMNCLL